mmetsp:Transcript_16967/g.42057  ORF Transcript_16967/g.42057 Transcript_16967/m.42057 type:complete len:374 (+) Transcript_16967:2377-3498(+)
MHERLVVADPDVLGHLEAGDDVVLDAFLDLVLEPHPGVHHLHVRPLLRVLGRNEVGLLLGKRDTRGLHLVLPRGVEDERSPAAAEVQVLHARLHHAELVADFVQLFRLGLGHQLVHLFVVLEVLRIRTAPEPHGVEHLVAQEPAVEVVPAVVHIRHVGFVGVSVVLPDAAEQVLEDRSDVVLGNGHLEDFVPGHHRVNDVILAVRSLEVDLSVLVGLDGGLDRDLLSEPLLLEAFVRELEESLLLLLDRLRAALGSLSVVLGLLGQNADREPDVDRVRETHEKRPDQRKLALPPEDNGGEDGSEEAGDRFLEHGQQDLESVALALHLDRLWADAGWVLEGGEDVSPHDMDDWEHHQRHAIQHAKHVGRACLMG